jgi:hypothetical protein
MSTWKALACAREVPDSELRERLVEAYEAIFEIGDAVSVSESPCGTLGLRPPTVDRIREAVDELVEERVDEAVSEAEQRSDLEGALTGAFGVDTVEAVKDRLTAVERERDAARAELARVRPIVEVYSDAIAAARKLVACAKDGPPAKHVRAVKGGR